MAKGLPHLLGHMGLLGHTAAQADDLLRVAALHMDQRPQVAQHPLLGVLPDGAGVQNDDPGLLLIGGEVIAHLAQIAPDALGVGLVLLAAIGVHKGQGSLPRSAFIRAISRQYCSWRSTSACGMVVVIRSIWTSETWVLRRPRPGILPGRRARTSVCVRIVLLYHFFRRETKKSGTEKSSCRHLPLRGWEDFENFCKPSRFSPFHGRAAPPHCLFPEAW